MTSSYLKSSALLVGLALAIGAIVPAGSALAATEGPIKEIEANHFGWEVNATTGEKTCSVASHDVCQAGKFSSAAGGFESPVSVAGAGAGSGNIYIVDRGNHRVQELEPDGKFVLMFGTDVNGKGGDLCTAAEESKCQAGVEGNALGQFALYPQSIAVDPASGDVYVAEMLAGGGRRVQGFTATGEFVLVIGREVNETKDKEAGATGAEKDVCTEEEIKASGVKCTVPVAGASVEPGALNFTQDLENILVVGGPEDLLYVGDEHRVQEFDAKTGASDGHYKREISLTSLSSAPEIAVTSIAVDGATGDVYLLYGNQDLLAGDLKLIREFGPTGTELKDFPAGFVLALAVDAKGLLAASENVGGVARGSLYEVGPSLHLLTQFASYGTRDIAFNDNENELYAAFGGGTSLGSANQEVIAYEPKSVGELSATGFECLPGSEQETDATFDCSLKGKIDPWGVSETAVSFEWGRTEALGERTEPAIGIPITKKEGEEETQMEVSASLASGVRPNEKFYDELVGEDHNVKSPELLTSATGSFTTPSVPPRVIGEPTAAFVRPTSAVLFGELNPENTLTSYEFEYVPAGQCKQSVGLGECEGILAANVLSSPAYGKIGVAQEVTGLQPSTLYRYRLTARNAENEQAVGETGGTSVPEGGTFETAPAPAVTAQTGGASAITTTSAIVTGSVNPDGQPSTYTFEAGVYNGAETRYGTVLSKPAGAGTEPVQEALALTGLQPATTYAYRIAIHYGDGTLTGSAATGRTMVFTTLGLPEVLPAPGPTLQLAIPPTKFPSQPKTTAACKRGYQRDKQGKCVKGKAAKKKRSVKARKTSRPSEAKHAARP